MSFPISPTNGQISIVNNVAYQYATVNSSWTRVLSTANIIQANTISTNVLTVSSVMSIAGNITTGNYFIGNGSFLTGIASGNNNYSNANVANYLPTYTGNLISLTGPVTTTSNVTGGNILFSSGIVSGTGTVYAATVSTTGNVNSGYISTGQASVGNLISGGYVSATGNITGGNLLTSAQVIANGEIQSGTGFSTGGYLSVNGDTDLHKTNVTGNLSATGNIISGNLLTGGLISVAGNITGGNLSGTNIVGTLITASQTNITAVGTLGALTVTANTTSGNLLTGGLISATGNITGGNIIGTIIASSFSTSGNITGGNLLTGGLISATGNITGGNLSGTNIVGTLTTAAQTNITSVGTLGSLTVTANTTSGNLLTAGLISVAGNITANTASFFIGNGSQLTGITAVSSYGNANVVANLAALGTNPVSTTGNVTGSYFIGDGSQLTNLPAGNYSNANVASYLPTYTGSLPSLTGALSTTGNITGGNISAVNLVINSISSDDSTFVTIEDGVNVDGEILATGNITGSYILGNGSQLTGLATTSITTDSFTGNGSTTTFTLSTTPSSINATTVNYNGVTLLRSSYSVNVANVIFSSAPANNSNIEITTLTSGSSGSTGSSLIWNIASSNATMTASNGYFVDTSSSAKTMTLPASVTLGDTIQINDLAGTFATNNLTVARNGQNIQGVANNLVVSTNQSSFDLVYSNSTYGWKILGL